MILGERVGESTELLAEGHRHGVLHLRAADLEDAGELHSLRREGGGELGVLGEQSLGPEHHGELDGGGVDVVRTLAAVHVVDGVQVLVVAEGVPHDLEAAVGDYLVGVHIGRGAGAALDDPDEELVVELALDDLLADPLDEVGLCGVENADELVRARGGLLDAGESADEVGVDRDRAAGDREVLEGARGVDSPVHVGRDLHRSERVALRPGGQGFGKLHDPRLLADVRLRDVLESGGRREGEGQDIGRNLIHVE